MNICEREYRAFARMTLNSNQGTFFNWVLENGKAFKGRTLTEKEQKWLQRKVSRPLFTPTTCVLQSQMGAMDGDLKYFEGQAVNKAVPIPIEHAWLVDKKGRVWDATWKDAVVYFGVEIPRDFIMDNINKTRRAEFLLAKYYSTCVEAVSSPLHKTTK